jgi:uncharacterized protein YndB with AHSA1/START domain
MLKWIGGCLVLVIVFIAGATWWGYRTMRVTLEPDGSARVAIAATPERVFATMGNADSVVAWLGQGNNVSVSRPGVFIPGSRVRISIRSTAGIPQQPMDWVIREVVPNQLIVRELVTEKGQRAALRRDSLFSKGDSTIVISNVASPLVDSIIVARDRDKGTTRGGMAGVSGDLMVSMFRFQSKVELQTLKAHIEGKPLKLK